MDVFSFLSQPGLRILAVAVFLIAASGPSARPLLAADAQHAGSECPGDCPEPLDVWVASTRRLPGVCRLPDSANLAIERLTTDGSCRCWNDASLADLLGEPWRPLVFFVHGNRYDSGDAKTQGISLARRLSMARPAAPQPRLVIFSWPSQKQGLALKDGRRKYARAYADGHYLAWLLGQVPPEQPVAVVGYSFGALVTAEALADLETVPPGGLSWADRPGRTQLVFVAPALRCDALAPRGPFRETLAGLDRLTLLINSRDEALRFFPLLEPAVRADALGYVGMPSRWLPPDVEYAAADAAGIVGKLHTMRRYLDSATLVEMIAAGTLDGLVAE
ncbi:MAG: alpha/beta fold hydrolase [Planctomycetota bacterium]|nr:alpha/beta fold hydrolase [Pirellulales bacterium]MDA0254265.1 alpha/beta fold hydrolase [Planctomycetota bacterium]MDA1200439.1 alpha/beta fold hydrolase [Planctomycetota bacterium]